VVVYISEAHPSDSPRARAGSNKNVLDPTTFEQRVKLAETTRTHLKLTVPVLIDGMDDKVAAAYAAHPDRLYIVGTDGKIAYQGGRGPRGFKIDEMAVRLSTLLKPTAPPPTPPPK